MPHTWEPESPLKQVRPPLGYGRGVHHRRDRLAHWRVGALAWLALWGLPYAAVQLWGAGADGLTVGYWAVGAAVPLGLLVRWMLLAWLHDERAYRLTQDWWITLFEMADAYARKWLRPPARRQMPEPNATSTRVEVASLRGVVEALADQITGEGAADLPDAAPAPAGLPPLPAAAAPGPARARGRTTPLPVLPTGAYLRSWEYRILIRAAAGESIGYRLMHAPRGPWARARDNLIAAALLVPVGQSHGLADYWRAQAPETLHAVACRRLTTFTEVTSHDDP